MRLQNIHNSQTDQAHKIKAKVDELSRPESIEQIVHELGAKDLDDLIAKLEQSPEVRQVIDTYNQIQAQAPLEEGFLSSIFSVLSGIVKSVTRTIGHVLGGLFQSGGTVGRLNYAGMLLLTFGLSGTLLATGAPTAVAMAALPLTASWWGMMWFGKNFLEPILRHTDG